MRVPRPQPTRRKLRLAAALACALLSVSFAQTLQAQSNEPNAQIALPLPASPQDRPYTLHVYTDLLQVSTLVLNQLHATWTGLTPHDFLLRVDAGPSFHPTSLHAEGNEPISLALVLDARGSHADVLQTLQPAIGTLFHGGLLSHDHVSVFAFDCQLVRSIDDVPADPHRSQRHLAPTGPGHSLHPDAATLSAA